MYFAILGKNPLISIQELQILEPENIITAKKDIITFDTKKPELLPFLGGVIKSGILVEERELPELVKDIKIIGIKEQANGKHLKQTIGIKRFKLVEYQHTDREIKEKGKELINIGNGKYGIVQNYQNIGLYEMVDFEKPGRSMYMGMMPAKLTHIMINRALQRNDSNKSTLIYDPFAGSGTTILLANNLKLHSRGSDITTKYLKQNIERWMGTKYYEKDYELSFFEHNVMNTLPENEFGKHKNISIVTEGWLGPIVSKNTSPKELFQNFKKIEEIYVRLIKTIGELSKNHNVNAVFTIPQYIKLQNDSLENKLKEETQKIGKKLTSIPELYQRPDQQVARKILIVE